MMLLLVKAAGLHKPPLTHGLMAACPLLSAGHQLTPVSLYLCCLFSIYIHSMRSSLSVLTLPHGPPAEIGVCMLRIYVCVCVMVSLSRPSPHVVSVPTSPSALLKVVSFTLLGVAVVASLPEPLLHVPAGMGVCAHSWVHVHTHGCPCTLMSTC